MNKDPMIFGEVLFDIFPDGNRVLGGAPFNVAWNLQAFGLSPRFISRVGDDSAGNEILDAMQQWGMNRDYIQIDPMHQTGEVRITLESGEPSYEIVQDCAYDYIDSAIQGYTESPLLYHGSLAIRNSPSRDALMQLLENHQGLVFTDINLRSPWWNINLIQQILKHSDWLKLNEDELVQIGYESKSLDTSVHAIIQDYNLRGVVLTQGSKGAIACTNDQQFVKVRPGHNTSVIDTVGAGDAFASVVIAGLIQEWSLEKILDRAQHFASKVVGLQGATAKEPQFYQQVLNEWIEA